MKIVIIGAGSSYTPELIEGFIERNKNIKIKHLCLVDIKEGEKKLNIIFDLTKRMFQKANINIKIEKFIGWKEAIKNADFILTQIRVGGLEARKIDEYIPGKYGMLGQETNGAGGLFKAMRTIPVIFDLVDDVKKHSKKNAWIINFTNPAGLVTQAVHSIKKFKRFVGLCNVPIHMKFDLEKMWNKKNLEIDVVGLNHFSYITKVFEKNKDITSLTIDKIFSKNTTFANMKNIGSINWDKTFVKTLGVLPGPYQKYFYKKQETLVEFLEKWKKGEKRADLVIALEKELFKKYSDPNLNVKPKELEERGGAHYSTAACSLVESIVTNDKKTHYINYLNNGSIKDFPNDYVLEYSVKIINGNIKSDLSSNKLTPFIKEDILKIKNFELNVVEAIKNKKIENLIVALIMHPLSNDDIKVKEMFFDLYNAHKKYLKKYWPDI